MPQIPLATPLAGIKVLEFSHTVMGPTAGLVFAEFGADVIKLEPAPKGDHTRGLGGFGAGFFAALNRNKRSRAMDLKRKARQRGVKWLCLAKTNFFYEKSETNGKCLATQLLMTATEPLQCAGAE